MNTALLLSQKIHKMHVNFYVLSPSQGPLLPALPPSRAARAQRRRLCLLLFQALLWPAPRAGPVSPHPRGDGPQSTHPPPEACLVGDAPPREGAQVTSAPGQEDQGSRAPGGPCLCPGISPGKRVYD